MSEKYWGKAFKTDKILFNIRAELYENEKLDDEMSIAKLILTKNFISMFSAKRWIEKKIVDKYDIIFIKDNEIIRRKWNG